MIILKDRNSIAAMLVITTAMIITAINTFKYINFFKPQTQQRSSYNKYQFLKSCWWDYSRERNIEFKEVVNTANNNIQVVWDLWYDGEIVASSEVSPKPISPENVQEYEEQMREWANYKVQFISSLRNGEYR